MGFPLHSQAVRRAGFEEMREVNLALVSKLGWKLLTHSDSLWVSQMHCKYLKSSSFLSPVPFFFFLMAMERHPEIFSFHLKRCLL